MMFKKLTEFGYKRNTKEAIGFYLAYLLLTVVGSAVAGFLFSIITGSGSVAIGIRLGIVISVITSMLISFIILKKKKLLGNFKYLLLALLAGVLAAIGGGTLGLIPASYLSTR